VLTIPNPVGQEGSKTVPIPKGTQVHTRTAPLADPDAVLDTDHGRHDRSPYVVVIPSQDNLPYLPSEYNPRYFEDPAMYKPSRWYGLPGDSELFTAFSVGELLLWPPTAPRLRRTPKRTPCMPWQEIRDGRGYVLLGLIAARLEGATHPPRRGEQGAMGIPHHGRAHRDYTRCERHPRSLRKAEQHLSPQSV
jgi:hypothetical protein